MSVTIICRNAKRRIQKLKAQKNTIIVDVTSKSDDPTFVKFSPFFPHGAIPVPTSTLVTESVEGAWQGLKVFELEGVDLKKLRVRTMKGLKRPGGVKRGRVLGHSLGQSADASLQSYVEARNSLYVPMYNYVLEHKLSNELSLLKGLVREGNHVVLLDYEVNEDIADVSKPLSHASLVKKAILNDVM